jgi:glycosyltransferase involved in cell wall biosynthesis
VNPKLSHLAFFLPSLSGGGAERVILDVAREAARHIERVDLVLVQHTGAYALEDPGRVNIIDLGKTRALAAVLPLARYLKAAQPQAIISATPQANIATIMASRMSSGTTKVIISEHSMMTRHQNPGIKTALMLTAMKRLYQHADRAIAISEQVMAAMIKGTGYPSERVDVVHNPSDLDRIRKLMEAPPIHPWLLDPNGPVIITAGRLVVEKDQATLVRAIAAMRRKDIRLVIFGEGYLRGKLESLRNSLGLQDRVDLPGFVSNPYAEMARANVFALPSVSEGFANVIIEALACNTCVVATRATGGIADSIEDGDAVRLVKKGAVNALAATLEACLVHPPDECTMRSIANRFSIDRGWEGYRNSVIKAFEDVRA